MDTLYTTSEGSILTFSLYGEKYHVQETYIKVTHMENNIKSSYIEQY